MKELLKKLHLFVTVQRFLGAELWFKKLQLLTDRSWD
jgi:hypothetical protein